MTGVALELMADLDKETVDLEPNYDDTRTQPTVLRAASRTCCATARTASRSAWRRRCRRTNLREICAALRAILDDPLVPVTRLLELVPVRTSRPAASSMGRQGILKAYTTGRGLIRVRARYHVEDKGQKQLLVFTEIPYQTRKAADKTGIIPKMVEVVKDGRITGIYNVEDQSSKDGMRLVVELKKGEDPRSSPTSSSSSRRCRRPTRSSTWRSTSVSRAPWGCVRSWTPTSRTGAT